MNYRGFGLAWLVLWLLAAPAGAAPVTVGALALNAAEVWQRASAQEETDFDSVVLRLGEGFSMLEVFLPRQRARPKLGEAKFIEQLEIGWRRRYGPEVALEWLEIGGKRWRVCRRPSRSGDGQVFQMVTLHAGEVYQVVAVTQPETDHLPLAVQALLGSAVWGGVPAKVAAVPAQAAPVVAPAAEAVPAPVAAAKPEAPVPLQLDMVKPEPAPAPAPVQAAKPASMAAPVVAASTPPAPAVAAKPMPAPSAVPVATAPPAPVAGKWRLLRSVLVLPGGKAWAGLADAEGHLLGTDGPVTGLGLAPEVAGLSGFLEGLLWRKGDDGRERRQTFRRHWRVRWPAMPELWPGGEALAVDLEFQAEVAGLDTPGDLTARFELVPICAPRKEVVRWLDGLAGNGQDGLRELTRMACQAPAAAPAPVAVTVAAKDYPAAAGGKVVKRMLVPLPGAWEQGIKARDGEVRRLALIGRFQVSEAGNVPGDALLRQAVAVFVFGN